MRFLCLISLLFLKNTELFCAATSCKELNFDKDEIMAEIGSLKKEVEKLKDENKSLKQDVVDLKKESIKRSDPVSTTNVAFHANVGPGLITLKDDQIIKYSDIITNLGHAYDATTGVFRAPTSGYYVFLLEFLTMQHNYLETLLRKNGLNVLKSYAASADYTSFGSGSSSIVIYLAAGDQVWVQVNGIHHGAGANLDGSRSTFAGFLLYAIV